MQLSDVTGHRLTVDLAAQTITVASSRPAFGFAVDALQKDLLLQCIDVVSSTLAMPGRSKRSSAATVPRTAGYVDFAVDGLGTLLQRLR